MIKSNELRLGNYVFDDLNTPMKVARIETQDYTDWNNGNDFNVIIEPLDGNGKAYYESVINAIELTEEWLERFGFEILVGWLDVWRKDGFDRFELTEIHDEYFFNDTKIEFVHQLQNAFFCIEQTELTHD